MKKYDHKKIEKKWQAVWEKERIYQAKDFKDKKYYALIEFPYPSGDGLHVGHIRSYTAMDIVARKRRMEGYNVLYPIGWDAFGLPTENYAIKTGIHPKEVTKKNTDTFRRQLKSLGFSFDWNREVNTTDPEYYKWTQWMFIQFFKHGLAYKANTPINWCLSCKIGLANEEVVNGRCERCGGEVEKRNKDQWLIRITKYAEKLLEGLKKVDYIPQAKIQQENWIGKSEGAEIEFGIKNHESSIKVFTTRPDTLFGVTYMVLAPEHSLIQNLESGIENSEEVKKYIEAAKRKTETERTAEGKDKTGVELKGIKAISPATKKEISVWVADYVLGTYGTGAIMAVPAHDKRDHEFAKKFNIPIVPVIEPPSLSSFPRNAEDIAAGAGPDIKVKSECYPGEGIMINSGKFNGMSSVKAQAAITKFVGGVPKVRYKLRDWVFSRHRYWGEPIPLVFCRKCEERIKNQGPRVKEKFFKGELLNPGWVPVPDDRLPVKLPNIKNYQPTDTGESPLAAIADWVNTTCPKCNGPAKRETDVMPNWAGSSWYFLAYLMKRISDFQFPVSNYKKVFKYWMPVDWYNGGMEHTTLHLLYSRFWNMFLYDIGAVPVAEPYKKRTSHGFILGEGNVKMSKSRGNVINPDSLVEEFGADALRLYEMFLGPFDQMATWNPRGILGPERFLKRVWEIGDTRIKDQGSGIRDEELERLLHQTIKKISEDIENMSFNTAVSVLMIFINACYEKPAPPLEVWKDFLVMLAPFAPHITEELWESLGEKESIHVQPWPKYNSRLVQEKTFELVIQINGKIRGKVQAETDINEDAARALAEKEVNRLLSAGKIKKVIFVKNRLINFII